MSDNKHAARIGVLSDTHNNVDNLVAALTVYKQRNISRLVHCGDITNPDMLKHFAGFTMWFVRGNNDHDWLGLRAMVRRMGNLHYCGMDAQLDFDGHMVAVCHGDDESLVGTMSFSGAYEWVFFGHSHRHELTTLGTTKVLNPGALGGRHPRGEHRQIAIVDLAIGQAEFLPI